MRRIGYPASIAAALLLFAGCTTPTKPPADAPTAAPISLAPATTGGTKADLAEARRLAGERQFPAARSRYEQYLAKNPNDADARFWYGYGFYLQAEATDAAAAARALRQQAREQMLQAQKLGCTEPLLLVVLDGIQADGSIPPKKFSAHRRVDALMREAEQAFSKGNYAEAATLHEQALAIEPTNYEAALFCGDAYFSQKDYATAGLWFAKAIAINPDIETAHRYWGDALVHLRRNDDALAQYIEAVVADPYNRLTRARFRDFAKAILVPLRTEPLRLPPGRVALKDGKPEIQLDPSAGLYGGGLGLAYAAACIKVRVEEFASRFPQEKQPRRTLVEEVEGLRTMLKVAEELAESKSPDITADDITKWAPVLKTLAEIDRDGLLEPFVLLERADPELAKDYAPYRTAHREQLIRFIRVYWCGRP